MIAHKLIIAAIFAALAIREARRERGPLLWLCVVGAAVFAVAYVFSGMTTGRWW